MFNYHWIDTLNRSRGLVYFVAIPLVQCEIYLHVSTWLLTWLFILEEKLNRIALLHYFIEPFRLFQINCKISAVSVVQALCCATIQDIKLTWLILLGSVSGNTQLTLLLTCYFLLLVQQWSHRYGGSWKPGDNMYMTARAHVIKHPYMNRRSHLCDVHVHPVTLCGCNAIFTKKTRQEWGERGGRERWDSLKAFNLIRGY